MFFWNFLAFEEAEDLEIKLPSFLGSWRKLSIILSTNIWEDVVFFFSRKTFVVFENNVENNFAVIPLWENCIFPSIISSWQWSVGM